MFVRSICLSTVISIVLAAAPFSALSAEDAKTKKEDGAAQPVAKIGDKETITKEEFDRTISAMEQGRLAMMRQRGQGDADPNAGRLTHDQKLRTLASLVDSRIVLMMAREAGIAISDDAVNAEIEKNKVNLPSGTDYATFLQQRGLTEREVSEKTKQRLEIKAFEELQTKDVTVAEDEVKQQFDKMKADGVMDDFDVQHILVKAPQGDAAAIAAAKTRIDAVHGRLKKGEDFSTVAKEVTEDSGSKSAGGEYKGVHRGQMVPEFDKHMAEATVGEISEPFTTQFGWHILKVNRHGSGELTPELSDRIKKQMLDGKRKIAMSKLIQDKRSTLDITINLPASPPTGGAPKALDPPIDAAS